MKKNHPEVTVGTGTSVGRDQPISFQNELESLRERLNQTEKRLSEESEARRSAEEENVSVFQLLDLLVNLNVQIL